MKLKPVIASYLGESRRRMNDMLTPEYIDVIRQIASASEGPTKVGNYSKVILNELEEMHVLEVDNGLVQLKIAVFFEDDIKQIISVSSAFGKGLANIAINAGEELMKASPEVRNFLGGVIGLGQSNSKVVKKMVWLLIGKTTKVSMPAAR